MTDDGDARDLVEQPGPFLAHLQSRERDTHAQALDRFVHEVLILTRRAHADKLRAALPAIGDEKILTRLLRIRRCPSWRWIVETAGLPPMACAALLRDLLVYPAAYESVRRDIVPKVVRGERRRRHKNPSALRVETIRLIYRRLFEGAPPPTGVVAALASATLPGKKIDHRQVRNALKDAQG